MALLLSSIGIIFGSIVFAIGDYRVLVPAICCLVLSTLAFTTYARYKDAVLAGLIFFLLVFFNYNLRAEHLEYFDVEKHLNANHNYYLEIVNRPKQSYFFQDEFIVEIKEHNSSLSTQIKEWVLPLRLLAQSESSKGLAKGDILAIENNNIEIKKLKDSRAKAFKKDKVFFQLANKNKLTFVDHRSSWVDELQNGIKNYYAHTLSNDNAQIISSLLLGTRISEAPQKFLKQVRQLGLGHFFAASGFHLLVLTVFISWLCTLINIKNPLSSIIKIASIALYSALAGFSPSIVRAAIFISAYLGLELANRKLKSLKVLFILAGIVLFIDPYTIFDLGFQFSYLAALGILIWAEPIKEKLSSYGENLSVIKDILTVSLAVQVFLLPLIVYYFSNLQIWSILANLLLSTFLSLLVILSFMGLSFIIEPLLNIFKYFLNLSDYLPFIDLKLELSFNSVILLMALLNLIVYNWTQKKDIEEIKKSISSNPFVNFFKGVLTTPITRYSLIFSLVFFLLVSNLPPIGINKITLEHGKFKLDKESSQVIQKQELNGNVDYKYFTMYGLKGLIVNNLESVKDSGLWQNLKEIHLLIIPKLKASDIYLDTLIKITKPQLVITSMPKESQKAKENLQILGSHAHTIVNSGILYFNKNNYWSIRQNP